MRPIDDDKLVLNKITIEMILHGLERDIIRITDEGAVMGTTTPGGVVCAIGDDWFYAFGTEGENCTPKEYRDNVPLQDIAQEIFAVLDGNGGFETESPDEYEYCYLYLKERGC